MSRQRSINVRRTVSSSSEPRYFVITITNFPSLLQRTRPLQQPSTQHCPHQMNMSLAIPNVPTHPNILAREEHERHLYEELQMNLQHVVEAYLQRTQQMYPIRFVFDFSHVSSQ